MQQNPKLPTTPPLPGVVAIPAMNDALQTVATDFSGDTDPAALAWPFSKWADTSTGLLKRRNAAGTAWVVVGSLLRRPVDAYAGGEIPTTDQGPVFVSGQGNMEWTGSRYVATDASHGQCRLMFVSSTECRLMPYNGNGLVINGRQYRIAAGGIPLPIGAVAGANGTANYVYAKDDGSGGISLEGVTTGHARHSDGVEIKSGDPTRTLVGMAFKNASGQFQFDGIVPGVASWFNRYSNIGRGSAYLAGTASASPVSVAPAVNTWVWAGEAVEFGTAGVISSDTAGIAPTFTIFLDGVAENASYGTIPVANGSIPAGMYAVKGGLDEGFHYIDPRLSSGGSGTAYLTCGYFVSNKR